MSSIATRFLVLGALAASLVAGETLKFQLSDRVHVGQTELKPGKYLVDVNGTNAVLKDKSGKTIDVKARVEQTSYKLAVTTMDITGEGSQRRLASVTPGGSSYRVVFE